MSAEDKKAMKEKLTAECTGKEGATETDIEPMRTHDVPTTPAGKCFLACVLESLGLVCCDD